MCSNQLEWLEKKHLLISTLIYKPILLLLTIFSVQDYTWVLYILRHCGGVSLVCNIFYRCSHLHIWRSRNTLCNDDSRSTFTLGSETQYNHSPPAASLEQLRVKGLGQGYLRSANEGGTSYVFLSLCIKLATFWSHKPAPLSFQPALQDLAVLCGCDAFQWIWSDYSRFQSS